MVKTRKLRAFSCVFDVSEAEKDLPSHYSLGASFSIGVRHLTGAASQGCSDFMKASGVEVTRPVTQPMLDPSRAVLRRASKRAYKALFTRISCDMLDLQRP